MNPDRINPLQNIQVETLHQDIFSHIQAGPPDPISGTQIAFQKDPHKDKINLGIGAYRDDEGKPYVFDVVRKAESILNNKPLNYQYLPLDGHPGFCNGAKNLLFSDTEALKQGRIATLQTISGTGSLFIGFQFLKEFLPKCIYISDPTWPNHSNIIQGCNLQWKKYPYYNYQTFQLNIPAMTNFFENDAIEGSIVLLQVCAHNPTGVDPNMEQWKQIAKALKKRRLIPYFDIAYQGFATGNLDNDSWPIKYFLSQGFQMIVSQSFAKNMGLYGQRVGVLHFVTSSKQSVEKIISQLRIIVRRRYIVPPLHGAALADIILNDNQLFEGWKIQLRDVVNKRIVQMRKALRQELEMIGAPGKWNHITDQIGMFSYTGLTQKECETLINRYHVYLIKSGRISISGVNRRNIKYLAESIKSAILENQKE